ncbi:MAG TPA: TIM barrel protein [Gemmataceae bacterium]|nr:TIM barrel protein [Gemmataceae bacterium]
MKHSRRAFLGSALAAGGLAAVPALADDKPRPLPDDASLGKTPHTKFAVNVEMWSFGTRDFLKRLEGAAKLGFSAVEFWPWRGKDINAVAETCERLKLAVAQFTAWGFTPGLNETKNHNRFVEEVEASCETAKKLRCKMMCIVAGNDVKGLTQEQMHENVITGIRKAVPVLEKHDMTLILEPMNIRIDHKGHCLYGSAPAVRILKAVGSKHVRMLYDAYHMEITEGDLCGHLKEHFDWIAYVQIADNPGRNDPGTGEIHYPRVLRQLHELGYRGHVGLEFRPIKDAVTAARAVWRADQW